MIRVTFYYKDTQMVKEFKYFSAGEDLTETIIEAKKYAQEHGYIKFRVDGETYYTQGIRG